MLPERGVAIFPLWRRVGEQAKRAIVQVRNGSRAPLRLLPGLALHAAEGNYTSEADAVLKEGEALSLSD